MTYTTILFCVIASVNKIFKKSVLLQLFKEERSNNMRKRREEEFDKELREK